MRPSGDSCERLRSKEKLLGPDHPEVATTLNNLALLRKSQDRPAEAEALYRRALSIFERALDPSHPSVVACRENLARLLKGRHDVRGRQNNR